MSSDNLLNYQYELKTLSDDFSLMKDGKRHNVRNEFFLSFHIVSRTYPVRCCYCTRIIFLAWISKNERCLLLFFVIVVVIVF